ncbi:MAG: hypothetical protein Q8N96_10740 [Methylovulum sp.]|nr:hypothetical protein [Methylovulum sp.]
MKNYLSFPRSGVGMQPGTLQRPATLERCQMNSHAGAWELYDARHTDKDVAVQRLYYKPNT